MDEKIDRCPVCRSQDIEELNPEDREKKKRKLVKIKSMCHECGHQFISDEI